MNTQLLRTIDPQTFAIVWMTTAPLGPDCPHYPTFHYLFDGILQETGRSEMGFFEGRHYGKKIFLLHTVLGDDSLTHIKRFHNLICTHRSPESRMVFVSKTIPPPIDNLIRNRLQSEYGIVIFDQK